MPPIILNPYASKLSYAPFNRFRNYSAVGGGGGGGSPADSPQDGDPYFANVVSLLHFDDVGSPDETIIDYATAISPTTTWTRYGNAQQSSVDKKYGSGSLRLDGSGDYLIASSCPAIGTGDFTVEFWARFSAMNDWQRVITSSAYNSSGGFNIEKEASTGKLWFEITDPSSRPSVKSNASVVDNAWHHFACQRINKVLEMYIDGTRQSASATDSTPHNLTSTALRLGTGFAEDAFASAASINGYIDDVRITVGVARYGQTSPVDFTPPTAAYPDY